MTALTYTTGNPSNLTAGATASMNDIQGPFTDIRTFLSSTNIDYSNIAAVVQSQYVTIETALAQASGLTAGTFLFNPAIVATTLAQAGAAAFNLDSSDYPSGTRSPKLRVLAFSMVNNTAPAISYTYGLYPIATSIGGAGSNSVTVGAVVAGSTCTITTPAANSTNNRAVSTDFSFPTAGAYALGVVPSGSETANALLSHRVKLMWHPV